MKDDSTLVDLSTAARELGVSRRVLDRALFHHRVQRIRLTPRGKFYIRRDALQGLLTASTPNY